MAYRIFISSSQHTATEHQYVRLVKNALYRLDDFSVQSISVNDLPDNANRLTAAHRMIDDSNVFIGIYGAAYGTVPEGKTNSYAELEYQYARGRGITCLIFVPAEAHQTEDARQAAFLEHLSRHHVIHKFDDLDTLSAKLKLALNTYRKVNDRPQLKPPALNFSAMAEGVQGRESEAFEAQVNRAYSLIEDDIEALVRRSLELHNAQQTIRKSEAEVDTDGLITVRPIFGEPIRRTQFDADIFMIMPFRERFNNIYNQIIRPAVEELNLTIKRGDEFNSTTGVIMQEVWAAIYNAELVIVETTEINANVYYELGIAHALGKPAVLLTQTTDIEEWPFDIRHLRFLVYEDSISGGQQLAENLKQSIVWLMNDLEEQGDIEQE